MKRLPPFATIVIAAFPMALLLTLLVTLVGNRIDRAGGPKQILIDVGKDAKDIITEIQKHEREK